MRKSAGYAAFGVCCLSAIAAFLGMMVLTPSYHWQLTNPNYHKLLVESVAIFALLVVVFFFFKRSTAIIIAIGITFLFAWIHVIFFPVVLGTIYILSLFVVGAASRNAFFRGLTNVDPIFDFLFGSCSSILVVLFLSAFGLGSIENIRAMWILVSCFSVLLMLSRKNLMENISKDINERVYVGTKDKLFYAVIYAAIIVLVMVQLGKSNLALDYDSIWYGLRPEYVLTTGKGVFEDLGLIASVYTYPKALEMLLLPISGLPSYAFLTVGNALFGVVALGVVYRLSRLLFSEKLASLAVVLVVCIPGVANVFLNMKPDIFTLLLQVIMLYFAGKYFKKDGQGNLYGLWASFLLTLGCKPTSIVFSVALMVGIFVMLFHCHRDEYPKSLSCFLIYPFVAILTVVGTMYRTWIVMGVPMTSLASGFFESLGFSAQPPYSLSNQVFLKPFSELLSFDGICEAVLRLLKIGFLPNSSDMDHICIAWGTPLVTLLCVFVCAAVLNKGIRRKLADRNEQMVVVVSFFFVLVASLGSMVLLSKPDGNYFVLLYTTSVLAFLCVMDGLSCRPEKIAKILCPLIIFGYMFAGASGWAWQSQFFPADYIHCGYYPHQQNNEDQLQKSCPKIADIILRDDELRVSVVGSHEFSCMLPAVAEEWITANAFGDYRLLESVDSMISYLRNSGKQYVLVEKEYLHEDGAEWRILEQLYESCLFGEIVEENGYILAEILPADD